MMHRQQSKRREEAAMPLPFSPTKPLGKSWGYNQIRERNHIFSPSEAPTYFLFFQSNPTLPNKGSLKGLKFRVATHELVYKNMTNVVSKLRETEAQPKTLCDWTVESNC